MSWQALAQAGEWPAASVRDTVAAIVRQAAYQRASAESLWTRLRRVIGDWWDSLFDFVAGSVGGRTVTIALLIMIGVLVAGRLLIALHAARESANRPATANVRNGIHDPWADAHRFASRGAFTDAAHALLSALIAAFAARGEVRLHDSKTAGDYARELFRSGSRVAARFDAFRRRYDRVIYGDGSCNAQQYEALLADAHPILAGEVAA